MLIRDKQTQDILLNSRFRLYNWNLEHLNNKKRTIKTFFNELNWNLEHLNNKKRTIKTFFNELTF
jgi:hypothetical protein